MAGYGPPIVDFSALGDLPQAYQQGVQFKQQQDLRNTFKNGLPMNGGMPDWGAISNTLAQSGNPMAAIQAAKLGQPKQMDPYQSARIDIEKAKLAQAPQGKPLSEPVIDKLSSEGGSYSTLGSLIASFKPEYAGYTAPQQIELAKRGYPTLNGDTDKQASEWWDHYGSWAEVIRNKLYGSVLTASDVREFERYRVTPTTDPEVIPKNLAAQQKIVADAIQRKSKSLKASGYSPDAINAAYGLDANGNFQNAQPETAPSGGKGDMLQPAPQQKLQAGMVVSGHVYLGGNPNDPNSWKAQ